MLLLDELVNIKKLHSATAIMNVKKDAFYVKGHFPGHIKFQHFPSGDGPFDMHFNN